MDEKHTHGRPRLLLQLGPWALGTTFVLLAFVVFAPNFSRVDEGGTEPRQEATAPSPAAGFEAGAPPTGPSARGGEAETSSWKLAAVRPRPDDAKAPPKPSLPLDCIIEPFELLDVRSPVRGRIERIHVERGDPVEAKDLLVQLDSSVEEAAVQVARARAEMTGEIDLRAARLELGESKQSRAARLYSGDALSADQREEAETEAKVARMELRRARDNRRMAALELERALAVLERRSIRSPISGTVVSRLMTRGDVVDEETILRVAQTDPLRVEVILPAELYGSVAVGRQASVTPIGPEASEHLGRVTIVDPLIDAASSTFGVQLELPNPDRRIPAGLRCRVQFLD